MNFKELRKEVESYGVSFPRASNVNHGFNKWACEVFGMEPVGTGSRREYDGEHVRRIVAWQLTGDMMGMNPARRDVARLLALADHGYVISDAYGARHCSEVDVRDVATLIFLVPEWHH